MMTPVARLIVVSATPKDKLLTAMGWFTMPALVGPLIGPPIAGLVLSVADWPWIFYINLPVGLLGMTAVLRFVPRASLTATSAASTRPASSCPPWRSAAWSWWPKPPA
ncbi:MFS transporter [Caulobacter segnis]